jgi:hypothetical protein
VAGLVGGREIVAVACRDEIRAWDPAGGALVAAPGFGGHALVAYEGRLLAVSGLEDTWRLRDVLTGEAFGAPFPARGSIVAAVVHRGRVLVASPGAPVRAWDVAAGAEVALPPLWLADETGEAAPGRLALAELDRGRGRRPHVRRRRRLGRHRPDLGDRAAVLSLPEPGPGSDPWPGAVPAVIVVSPARPLSAGRSGDPAAAAIRPLPRYGRCRDTEEPQMITDPTILRIGEAVQLNHAGRREAARRRFEEIWEEIGGEQGDPLQRCTLAHAMADAQDDVRQELLWDQRALAAAGLITEARIAEAGVPLSVAGLYPSLHLNLSECFRKLGDLDRAREHLRQARDTVGALGDDDYGRLIRDGLEQVSELLRPAPPESAAP